MVTYYDADHRSKSTVVLGLTPVMATVSVNAMATSFTIVCPCCQGKLTIDPELEAVIAHEAPSPTRSAKDLGAAFDTLRSKSAEREERFRQQMQAEAQKGKLLDRKFQEGLKKAKDSPDPPRRPSDYD